MPVNLTCLARKYAQERDFDMCTHGNMKKINDVRVCLNCGLTILPDGKVMIDRYMPNYKPKKKRVRK